MSETLHMPKIRYDVEKQNEELEAQNRDLKPKLATAAELVWGLSSSPEVGPQVECDMINTISYYFFFQ